MHHRAARAKRASIEEHLGRRRAIGCHAGEVLPGLLGQVHVQRRAVALRPRDHRMHLIRRHRAYGVNRGTSSGQRAEHATGTGAEGFDPGRPLVTVAVPEPELRPRQRHRPATGLQPATGLRPATGFRPATA